MNKQICILHSSIPVAATFITLIRVQMSLYVRWYISPHVLSRGWYPRY